MFFKTNYRMNNVVSSVADPDCHILGLWMDPDCHFLNVCIRISIPDFFKPQFGSKIRIRVRNTAEKDFFLLKCIFNN